MTARPKRWAEVATLVKPSESNTHSLPNAIRNFELALAVVVAITKAGKTVRVEKAQYGEIIRFLVRRG